jgi:single-stranded-DNA-specific exonuclease
LDKLDDTVARDLEALEPFGVGNSKPLFYTRNLRLKGQPQVLGRDALKFWVSDGAVTFAAIGFGMGSLKDSLMQADSFDLVYSPRIDSWVDEKAVILEVEEVFIK